MFQEFSACKDFLMLEDLLIFKAQVDIYAYSPVLFHI